MEWWFAYDGKDLVAVVGMDPECKGEGEVYLNEIMAKAGGGYGVTTMKWLFDHYAKQPGVKALSFDSWSADNMDKLSAHYEKNFPDFKKEKNSWGGYTFTKHLEKDEEGQEELDQVAEDTKFTLTIGQLKRLIEESAAYVPVRGNVIFHLEWQSDYDGEESYRHRPDAFDGITGHLDDLVDDYDFDDKTIDILKKEIGWKNDRPLYGLHDGEYTHRFMSIEEAESFKQYCIDNIVRAGKIGSWTKDVTVSGDTLTWRSKTTTSSWISPNGNGHSVQKWFTFKCRIYIENLD
jgi:hypothetical protein